MKLSTRLQRAPTSSRRLVAVRCSASVHSTNISRRDAIIGATLALASPLSVQAASAEPVADADGLKLKYKILPVTSLVKFQKEEMRAAIIQRTEAAIKEYLDASDAPACVRLALLDAGSYDIATKKGGISGAVILSGAPLPAYVKRTVEKLKKVREAIDAGDKNGSGPISWADLIFLAGKVTSQVAWRKSKGAAGQQAGDPWSNPWDGVVVGRVDSDTLGPNKVPAVDSPVEEIKAYLLALGAKGDGGFLSGKPPFWEQPGFLLWTASAEDPAAEEARFAAADPVFAAIKSDYDQSRSSLAHSEYEFAFIKAYNKLTSLGAKYNPDAYLFPLKVIDFKL